MDNIIEPNESFDFFKLSLAHPVGIQGGAYFTKIEYGGKPLYIQTSKSLTKQGFVKTGKKYYCDLMFDKNSESLINWFENLESQCHKLIFEKKNDWFQGNLEENDIETAFNPLIRVYKSGKYYLLRTNVKNTKDDVPNIKIYDEKEVSLGLNDITSETEIISILEIQGIKFTSRNFQIEIEIKQVMVLDNNPIFESCLIKPNKSSKKYLEINQTNQNTNHQIVENIMSIEEQIMPETINFVDDLLPKNEDKLPKENDLESFTNLEELVEQSEEIKEENNEINIDFENLTEDIQENNDELKEISNIDFNLEKKDDILNLKKPNQIYFELYKEARNKAKQAKKNAILAYLEAKNIKKTYLIENINDSDSDFDAEIDEASESELEGL